MKLENGGITTEAISPADIAAFKRRGWVEVKPPEVAKVEEIVPVAPPAETVSIGEIYAMCDKAGVTLDSLVLGEYPTLAEVKAAIKSAKKAVKNV